MTKEALRDAFMAGFDFGSPRGSRVVAEQAFSAWWNEINETLDRGGPDLSQLAPGTKTVEPFDFSKLPRPGDANYKRRPTVEEQEAANFAAFDPDAFVPHPEPREDDE